MPDDDAEEEEEVDEEDVIYEPDYEGERQVTIMPLIPVTNVRRRRRRHAGSSMGLGSGR